MIRLLSCGRPSRSQAIVVQTLLGLAAVIAIGGCSNGAQAPRATSDLPADWRKVATSADRARLGGWRTAWVEALGSARSGGNARAIAEQGTLFRIDHALAQPLPPAGDYRCRVFKLGRRALNGPVFVAYPAFVCRIDREGAVASFYKSAGSQRPVGLLFPSDTTRGVFLGTMMLGDETRPIDYGRDTARDMAGLIERIGERRWRVVLPYPRFESLLDVVELVPLSAAAATP